MRDFVGPTALACVGKDHGLARILGSLQGVSSLDVSPGVPLGSQPLQGVFHVSSHGAQDTTQLLRLFITALCFAFAQGLQRLQTFHCICLHLRHDFGAQDTVLFLLLQLYKFGNCLASKIGG